jgi:hypothetical protein
MRCALAQPDALSASASHRQAEDSARLKPSRCNAAAHRKHGIVFAPGLRCARSEGAKLSPHHKKDPTITMHKRELAVRTSTPSGAAATGAISSADDSTVQRSPSDHGVAAFEARKASCRLFARKIPHRIRPLTHLGFLTVCVSLGLLEGVAGADEAPSEPGDVGVDDGRDVTSPTAAAAGADVIIAAAPTWCTTIAPDVLKRHESFNLTATSINERAEKEGLDESKVAWSACIAPNAPRRRKWVATWRQQMVNETGLTAQQNAEYLEFSLLDSESQKARVSALCTKLEEPAASLSANLNRVARRNFLECPTDKIDELLWSIARTQKSFPGPIASAMFVTTCTRGFRPRDTGDGYLTGYAPEFAMCSHEISRLNRQAFIADLKAQGASSLELLLGTKDFTALQRRTSIVVDAFAKFIKRAPALESILYTAPEAGFSEWSKEADRWSAPLSLALDYELKFERSKESKKALATAFAGCEAPLRKNFANFLASKRPTTATAVRAAASSAIGSALLEALATCDQIEGREVAAYAISEHVLSSTHPNVGRSWSTLGPHYAAYASAVKALEEVKRDQPNFPLSGLSLDKTPGPSRSLTHETMNLFQRKGGSISGGSWTDLDTKSESHASESDGEIATVSPSKDGVVIKFKSVSWQEPTQKCVDTKKVDRIEWSNGSGHVIYEAKCWSTGSESHTSTLNPISMSAALAEGLAPGMFVRILYQNGNGGLPGPGYVFEGYGDKTRKRLLYALGSSLTPTSGGTVAATPEPASVGQAAVAPETPKGKARGAAAKPAGAKGAKGGKRSSKR